MRLIARAAPVALLLLLATVPLAQAQAEESAVLAAVQQLFDAMAARDTAAAHAVLTPDGQFYAVRTGEGGEVISMMPHADFLAQLARAPEPWIERMWEPLVRIHGPIAMVWTPYDFYRGDTFSHCGVDIFNLIRTAEGWKIASTVYTVQRAGCSPSPLGPPAGRR